MLTGSRRLFAWAIIMPVALLIAGQILDHRLAPGRVAPVMLGAVATCCLMVTWWAFQKSIRESLVTHRCLWICGMLWVGIAAAVLLGTAALDLLNGAAAFILIGLSVLVVTPFAAAPLAVWFNRHR